MRHEAFEMSPPTSQIACDVPRNRHPDIDLVLLAAAVGENRDAGGTGFPGQVEQMVTSCNNHCRGGGDRVAGRSNRPDLSMLHDRA